MGNRLRWAVDGVSWPHHESSRFVDAAGLRWHVQVAGQGPVVWLLHGAGSASLSWRGLLPLLAVDHTVVVPDLPGHGFSGRLPPRQQSLPGMAAALAGLAQVLGLPPQLLVGHSAGAALALRATLDRRLLPQRVLGINAALLPYGGPAHPVLAGLARWLSRAGPLNALLARSAGDPRAVQRLVAATGSRLEPQGLALYARLLRSDEHLAGVLAMMGDWDLSSLWRGLPGLTTPLTLLVGLADAAVPPAQADQVAAHRPGTEVLRRAGLGHLAHEEAPQWVDDVLRWAPSAAR